MSSIPRKIKIVRTPTGEAPEWVRKAWIGCVLPCRSSQCAHVPGFVRGILSGNVSKKAGYDVPQDVAIGLLARKSPKAAAWWRRHRYPKLGQAFRFAAECAKMLESVPESEIKRIIHADDMETGRPRVPHSH